jgi:rhamnosyl/mannosyltransferase
VPPHHPEALHNALSTLWNNPERAAAMGHNARLRYMNFFTADSMVQAYVKLYKDVISPFES